MREERLGRWSDGGRCLGGISHAEQPDDRVCHLHPRSLLARTLADAISGTLYTFDIDPAMVERTKSRAAGRKNIVSAVRDVLEQGFGVTADAVLLFNILHCERPVELLKHASSALARGGRILTIHWRYGDTPRGPNLEIRPRPEQIIAWGAEAGLTQCSDVIDLPPWHFGLTLGRCEVAGS